MATSTCRHQVFVSAIHGRVIQMRNRQSSFVRVELFAWAAALLSAHLALPVGSIFDR